MRIKYINIFAVVLILVSAGMNHLYAQGIRDLRINEILVYNDSNYVDEYGKHSPWIEIFNSAYSTVNLGGLYITDDLSQPTKFRVSTQQPPLDIPSRNYLLFWADNHPSKGLLHLNFSLEPGKTIALFSEDGKTLVDSVTIPSKIDADVSWGRMDNGASGWGMLIKATPGNTNNPNPGITSEEKIKKSDPSGTGMILLAMGVVFLALVLLFLLFKLTARLLKMDIRKQLQARSMTREKTGAAPEEGEDTKGLDITGEIVAAITLTLNLYTEELHDAENTVLTINKVSRTYSPWSSKIYGLNRLPR